jgi:hypothetical protein
VNKAFISSPSFLFLVDLDLLWKAATVVLIIEALSVEIYFYYSLRLAWLLLRLPSPPLLKSQPFWFYSSQTSTWLVLQTRRRFLGEGQLKLVAQERIHRRQEAHNRREVHLSRRNTTFFGKFMKSFFLQSSLRFPLFLFLLSLHLT